VTELLLSLARLRDLCANYGLVPVYHYTSARAAPFVLQSGLRMSTQGQGDGGVYFSMLGPASYGLGAASTDAAAYEENLVKDCFGVERLSAYRGQGRVSAVLVYAVHRWALQPVPGGRRHAAMVAKADFADLSLPHNNGTYFLRPDRIVGAFMVDPQRPPRSAGAPAVLENLVAHARAADHAVAAQLNACARQGETNADALHAAAWALRSQAAEPACGAPRQSLADHHAGARRPSAEVGAGSLSNSASSSDHRSSGDQGTPPPWLQGRLGLLEVGRPRAVFSRGSSIVRSGLGSAGTQLVGEQSAVVEFVPMGRPGVPKQAHPGSKMPGANNAGQYTLAEDGAASLL
jgi:hypothetical protein